MLPMIEREVVDKHKWATIEEVMDYYAISQCTPGVIAVNTATFVGYKIGGFFGSLAATLGVVLPSFVIIFIISVFLKNFLEITWVANAFRGIKVAVAFLIFGAGWKMFRKMKKKALEIIIFACALIVMLLVNFDLFYISAIYLILMAASVGIAVSFFNKKGGK